MIADASTSLAQWWGPALAFLAGLVSFASPCVLPLVPGYLSFVMGESAVAGEEGERRTDIWPVLLFIGGFTLVFVLYGAFAHQFVQVFKGHTGQLVAGVVISLLGVLMIGYALRRGACIGRNGGVIAAVRTGEVVISEWAVRADGTRDRTQTVIRLPKEAALNLEE